jgi:RNA recognition motif-containing protein
MDEQSGNIKAFEKALANAENRRLWIGNLDPTATAVELEEFFSGYNVENITFPSKRKRIRQRHGFVVLKNADEVGRAICELPG